MYFAICFPIITSHIIRYPYYKGFPEKGQCIYIIENNCVQIIKS
ncbi:hypothetical protein CLOSTASPAR_05694 [[Clostridium] asparagiforme DSM 15981]|uniref:Uncharacterized protein n=1 Tax=[Clostridium] asparagiforme DSM 15981 TaxID=518636 RepID=C0D8U6_9FIRM|nr:hypothetical protein CLOSTASPAR_05694 [[Clostridium] asparagiforme DSM 15981]